MRRTNYISSFQITTAFLLLFLNSFSQASYQTVSEIDKNGYTYESVTGDPTGLRLYTLENGLRVYLAKNNDEPKIQTYVAVRAGSKYDPLHSTGLAHYLEHMLFKGTDEISTSNWEKESPLLDQIEELYEKRRATTDPGAKDLLFRKIDSVSYLASEYAIANEYDKMLASIGAEGTNAHTSHEETVYYNKIPANELQKFLFLEKEKFSKLVLRLFHTELESVYEEFNRVQDDDSRKAYYALMDGLFPRHPYGQQTTIGTAQHLKNPSMRDIHEYFEKYYVPSNMALVLVGDLDFDKTIQMVEDTFGKLRAADVKHPELPREEPIGTVVSKEVYGPNAESISIGFRCNGIGSEDEKYLTLIDMILSNSTAGLFDLNLNQKQLVLSVSSSPYFYNDYGYLNFSGRPKAGQSLEELRDLMLGQVELIKQGDFEDWMIDAVVNDLKLNRTRQYENATSVAEMFYSSFIHEEEWQRRLGFLDELKGVSKQELVAFANDFFKENFVVVYKRQGKDEKIVKVKNPEITPVRLNNDSYSKFLQDFTNMEAEVLSPVFVDFQKEIESLQMQNGLQVDYIRNKNNELFSLYLIFDMGKDNNEMLPLAVSYLKYLGTDRYSAQQLRKEFYKLGIDYSVNAGNDRSYVALSGLQENLDKGLELLEHLMANAVPDLDAYNSYVARILKSREDAKSNKDYILWAGLMNYAMYGEDSRLRDIISPEEFEAIDPAELTAIVKELNNYHHRIFFYGRDEKKALAALERHHQVPTPLWGYPKARKYLPTETGGKVFFTNFDMVQTELLFVGKGDEFDAEKMAAASVFNAYFGGTMSSVVFQEIRESRSLAYAAMALYESAGKMDENDWSLAYLGTQSNKLEEAVEAMTELLQEMPVVEQKFEQAKESALKQIAAERITRTGIFWTYESLKRRGLDHDVREDMYKSIERMKISDLVAFFNENIRDAKYSVVIIGNKGELDLSSVQRLGEFEEMEVDFLFNYEPEAVKP